MHVGVLAHTGTFDEFLERASDLSDPREVSAALSESLTEVMIKDWDISEPRDWLLNISTPQEGGIVLLGTDGGLTSDDAFFLLRILWEDRKGFTEICAQTTAHGWMLPLMLLDEHTHWALKAGS